MLICGTFCLSKNHVKQNITVSTKIYYASQLLIIVFDSTIDTNDAENSALPSYE